jgi:ABC-2 type transport system ATP-binding protein
VYMNASILGMRRNDVDRIFDDIVGFAGLEQFIDTPVKHYSSGMYIRLGFSVAINVDPEILLVDEVLAVGDEAFQRKCIDKVKTFQAEGRTIIIVTHAVEQVRQLCDHAAALDHGKVVVAGDPNDVIREFRERLMAGVSSDAEIGVEMARSELSPEWGKVKIEEIDVVYPDPSRHNVMPGEELCFDVHLSSRQRIDDIVLGIVIYGPMGQMVHGTNSRLNGAEVGPVEGSRTIRVKLRDIPLLDGTYAFTIGAHTVGGLVYDHWEQKRRFEVAAGGKDEGLIALPMQIEVKE